MYLHKKFEGILREYTKRKAVGTPNIISSDNFKGIAE